MTTSRLRKRLLSGLAGAAVLAAMPAGVHVAPDGWRIAPAFAFAKDGRDDRSESKSDRSESKSDRSESKSGRSESNDREDSGRSERDDREDKSRSERDDREDRDRSERDYGHDAATEDDDRGRPEVEISRGGIEVRSVDGVKEEIEGGRYERKDASGRTVEERPATQADIDRLRGLAGAAGVTATRGVASGKVAKVEIRSNGIEVENSDGSRIEIENGRYERKDASGRTVEERPATQADVDRLQMAARESRPVRRIAVGQVSRVERSSRGLEVLYATGWREELENGRYELKDPNGNTVVERVATPGDMARMDRLASR